MYTDRAYCGSVCSNGDGSAGERLERPERIGQSGPRGKDKPPLHMCQMAVQAAVQYPYREIDAKVLL